MVDTFIYIQYKNGNIKHLITHHDYDVPIHKGDYYRFKCNTYLVISRTFERYIDTNHSIILIVEKI